MSYRARPPKQVPGYADLHRMTGLLLAERVPDDGSVLVHGAGGGAELEELAGANPAWRFLGVDPSAEMLEEATRATERFADRIELHEGYIDDAPARPFDGATSILTLHFLPAAERLATLRELHRRLAPGAPLVVAHHSWPAEDRDRWLARYAAFASAPTESIAVLRERLPALSPEEDEALLREAGFDGVAIFYAGFTFRGWVAYSSAS